MAAEWTSYTIMVPNDELAPVNKGLTMQKMYAVMYDIASNHRDGTYIAMDGPTIYADKRSVSRMIRILQGAIIRDTGVTPTDSHQVRVPVQANLL